MGILAAALAVTPVAFSSLAWFKMTQPCNVPFSGKTLGTAYVNLTLSQYSLSGAAGAWDAQRYGCSKEESAGSAHHSTPFPSCL